ncbi:MAG: hypothetical protein RTU09_00405 [Candidatus Thorarchaeota archaeon]
MRRTVHILLLAAFVTFLILPMGVGDQATSPRSDADGLIVLDDGSYQVAGDQDLADWWNSTYIYRRYYNFTSAIDRTLTPVHLYLTFENGHCYSDSIRVGHYENPGWDMLKFQLWNTTYYSGGEFIESTRVSFMVNLTAGVRNGDYYIYYAKTTMGSVTYPDFYPFIYKTYTFSLINLVSFYDSNKYYIEMWDTTDDTWKDPRNVDNSVDTRWKFSQVSPNNVPDGTLDLYDVVRYEPTATDYNDFWGYYTVYSNYPLAFTAGTGDKNSNTATNDWYPGVNELGSGVGTRFILGGVEGFESRNEGKYWVQAHEDNTEVYIWTTAETPDSSWTFYNGTSVSSWPAILKAGEYVAKRDVVYSTYVMVNSTKPVSARAGDSDSTYARDIGGFFSSVTGDLGGEEFYTIDMGHGNDKTRVTNIGDSTVVVEWWRNTGSGWVKGTNLTILANSSAYINAGTASLTNPEDVLHIKGPANAMLFVEGIYNPTSVTDWGDWAPSMDGTRFGNDFRIWGAQQMKFIVFAWENAQVDITGYNNGQLDIPAGGVEIFMPLSSSQSLYDLHSNASINVIVVGRFYTSSPYNPSGDQGYGWMVPAYSPKGDADGVDIDLGDEIMLFEFDITVVDLDNVPVEGVTVTLYFTNGTLWEDDNGLNRVGTTDSNGLIVFEGLNNDTYNIRSEIDAAAWLSTSYSNVWIKNSSNHDITGSVTPVQITFDMASIDIHLEDLMGDSMNDNDDEDTNLRLNNGTLSSSDYVAQAKTNTTGWIHFHRVPKDDYDIYARYAGSLGWSYGYDDIDLFASWSIASLEFDSGSFSHSDWVMPLITLDIHVLSWDDQDVEGATVKINNSIDENAYSITKTTNADGDYSFYRIVNGTWNLDVWKDDDYTGTPLARNNTVSLTGLQGYTQKDMEIPITQLIVRVQTELAANVEGAQVNVTLKGFGLIAQGVTNSTGHVTFFYIHGNLSNPYSVAYNLTVQSGNQVNGTISELLAKCDYDWAYVNVIMLQTPTYSPSYTELNSTAYFVNVRWGRNASFVVGFYDRDGDGSSTSAISFGASSWLNFTIYYDGQAIGWGTWNTTGYDWVNKISAINFNITIDSDYWLMNVSETTYQLIISGNSPLDPPAPITVYMTVLAAETQCGYETDEIDEKYKTHSSHLFWLHDDTNDVNVTNLDVYTYTVKLGTTEIRAGSLTDNLNGTYSFPASALHDLDIGNYIVIISLEKINYVNRSLTVDAIISELPMSLTIHDPGDYNWSIDSESIDFEYIIWNGTNSGLSGVSVTIEWIDHDTQIVYLIVMDVLDASPSNLTYAFMGNTVPVGNWDVRITCKKTNYGEAFLTFTEIIVSEAPTGLTQVGPGFMTVDWSEDAVFEVDYIRTGDAVGLMGASFTHNWTGTVILEYTGSGRYTVIVDTTIPAASYYVRLTMLLANHESQYIDMEIIIRVPLIIETEYGSEETPLVAYWTRSFNITVRLLDNSRDNVTIDDGTIDYDWSYQGSPISQDNLEYLSDGIYWVTLDANDGSVLVDIYQIVLDATRADSVADSAFIFMMIEDVPNEVIIETVGFTPYYGDVVTVRFYWNNTLDNVGITTPSGALLEISPLGINIGSYINYGNGTYSVDVDTAAIGMNVDDYSGVYWLTISMSGEGFSAHDSGLAAFFIQETPTELLVDEIAAVEWSEDMTISVRINDTRHNELVWQGAVIEIVYGSFVIPLDGHADGVFNVTFDTALYFAASDAPFEIVIRYAIPNYVGGEEEVEIHIDPIAGEVVMFPLELQDGIYDGDWTDMVGIQLQVHLVDHFPAQLIPNATVEYHWAEFPTVSGAFSYSSGTQLYSIMVDTTEVPAGTRILRITVTLQNYTVIPYDLTMNLAPLSAILSTETEFLSVTLGVSTPPVITFSVLFNSEELLDAEVTVFWGGATRQADEVGSQYELSLRLDVPLDAPMIYSLNFTAVLQNYTIANLVIPIMLSAPTEVISDVVVLELDQTVTISFQYWDTNSDRAVASDPNANPIVRVYLPGATTPINPQFDGTYYSFVVSSSDLEATEIGEYSIIITASAYGYQNYTVTSGPGAASIRVDVREATYDFGPLGRYARTTVNIILLMTGLFIVIVGAVVGIRRHRIPYPIKQINKALKAVEGGKRAKVEKIKTMGGVISDVLAPGLAALDIAAPIIDEVTEDGIKAVLDEDAEGLLDELDALDEIGADEVEAPEDTPDFEAELAAEIETVTEETPEPEPESEIEAPPEEAAEEITPEADVEEVLEDESDVSEVKEEISESEPEAQVIAEEPELEADEAIETEELESDADHSAMPEEPDDEPGISEGESVETEPQDEIPSDTPQLSKKELIDKLLSDNTESMSVKDLKKLSKRELQALYDSMSNAEDT